MKVEFDKNYYIPINSDYIKCVDLDKKEISVEKENNIDVNNKQSSPVVYLNEDMQSSQNMQGSQGFPIAQSGKSFKKL